MQNKENSMKQMRTIITTFVLVGMLGAPAVFAQQRERMPSQDPGTSPGRPGMQQPATPRATTPETPPVPKASTFIGSSVENPQGENLGKIDDLVIDPATGRINYAVLSHGGVLGVGGKLFAVSWNALRMQPDGKTFVLDVSKETLDNAAGFDRNNWPTQPDPTLSAAAPGAGTGTMSSKPTAAGTEISATVQEVNAAAETVTLQTEQGERVQLQAPAAMLQNLQAGDSVEVKRSGMRATEIRKKE
jgi:sporulation protein YlmC with PRC-barrel domain